MEKFYKLRVKGPQSSVDISLDGSKSFGDLIAIILEKFGLKLDNIELLWGFPMKISFADKNERISDILSNNEMIRVQEKTRAIASVVCATNPLPLMSSRTDLTRKQQEKKTHIPGSNIVTLFGSGSKKSMVRSRNEGGGRRRPVSRMDASNEGDVSEHLLAAVSGGTGKKDKFLRY